MSLTDLSQVSTETVLQLIGSTQTVGAETPVVDELDASANIYRCHGTVIPTNGTAGYSKPGYFNKTNATAAVPGAYQNIGTTASCQFVLLDTAAGGAATSLIDSNGNTALDTGATASAVNNLRVTNSATGAVSANAVLLSAVGTDAAVSLSIVPKGVTGITTIGLSTGTGDVVLGSSSGAQTIKIANGTGVPTVNIASVTTVGGTTNIATGATASSADTVNIATGATTAAGGKVVHIADGTPTGAGTNLVTIGSNANTANVTTIQGGSGIGAITLTPQTTGTVVIGAAAGTGAVTLGSSSTTQTTNVGTGAGVSTVNVGTGVSANVITIGSTASLITVKGTPSAYQAVNQTTGSAVANAPVATLTDSAGSNITVATGLRIVLLLAAGLQAGANTLNLNGHGADSIKSHRNPATDIAAAYVTTGRVDLLFNGTVWLDMSQ